MITRFAHKGLKRLYEQGDGAGIRADMREKVARILTVLDAAAGPENLDLPGYRLHPLKGKEKGRRRESRRLPLRNNRSCR